ncbi:MAG: hypothetical protein JWL92_604 [Candidatus Nomurabacteria bacterium]|nr:hypothetical protein [Candidatus Nomurabacteria bacterium]
MEYSISVINEDGKNYFLVRHGNMRFLFRRLNASSLISSPDSDEMDKFEVRRDEGIIIAGECYNLEGKIPVFIINYSEVDFYNPRRNCSTPHEDLYAEDFLPDDMIFSEVNAHDVKAKGFASTMSFMEKMDEKMQSLKAGLYQRNIEMIISSQQTFIRRVENDQDAIGLKTFIVPPYL